MIFRCWNCMGEFEGAEPVCPACDIDGRQAKFATVVVPIVTIHFDPPGKAYGVGLGYRACDPAALVTRGHATGVPDVVNCKECRASEVWKKAAGMGTGQRATTIVPPEHDYPVAIDPVGMKIERRDK